MGVPTQGVDFAWRPILARVVGMYFSCAFHECWPSCMEGVLPVQAQKQIYDLWS